MEDLVNTETGEVIDESGVIITDDKLGIWKKSWRFIDRIIGPSIFNVSELSAIAYGFEKVTLIQSASWGFQDRLLGWMARKHKWRTVMMPYTTDQLSIDNKIIDELLLIAKINSFALSFPLGV